MDKGARTYLGASPAHLHCENYKFQPNTPLKVFDTDQIYSQLTWIDISGCTGTLDHTTFANLPNIEIISLDKCNIEKIEQNTFSAPTNLKSVNVRKSMFPLDANIFENCDKISNIRFVQVENALSNLLGCNNLKTLEYLMIDHTRIRLCHDTFSGLENLNYLFIQNCQIENFSADVFEPLVTLETFYFTGNELRQFDSKAFLRLTNLIILGLYDNTMLSPKHAPMDYQVFDNLPNLETINFPEEQIRSLKLEEFKKLKNVQLVIGKAKEDIAGFLEKKNIGILWTSDSDLTEDVDYDDPNIQICA